MIAGAAGVDIISAAPSSGSASAVIADLQPGEAVVAERIDRICDCRSDSPQKRRLNIPQV
jgi:hypothetical protein